MRGIVPVSGVFVYRLIKEALGYRGFVYGSILRQVRSQYQGSMLGAAWIFIGPVALLLVHTVVFSNVFRSRLPGVDSPLAYSVYLCAGLLPWLFFSDAVTRITGAFVGNAGLLKKARFPRVCLPLIAIGVSGFNFVVIAALFIAFLLLAGHFPGWVLVAALPALVVQTVLAFGFGIFLGVVNVFYRDVGQLVGVVFQFLFWLTPIVYPRSILPDWVRGLIDLNPLAVIVEHYQTVVLQATLPSAESFARLGAVALLAALGLFLGLKIHRDLGAEMTDEL
jgi:lipopolysaccharide transport system permease protein